MRDTLRPSVEAENYVDERTNTPKICVKVHIPENISENIRQQKINRIYDILKSENTH